MRITDETSNNVDYSDNVERFVKKTIKNNGFEEKQIPLITDLLKIYLDCNHADISAEWLNTLSLVAIKNYDEIVNHIKIKEFQCVALCKQVDQNAEDISKIIGDLITINWVLRVLFEKYNIAELIIDAIYQVIKEFENSSKNSLEHNEFLVDSYNYLKARSYAEFNRTNLSKYEKIHNECKEKINCLLALPISKKHKS